MPDSTDLDANRLAEVQRVMRKQLAAWCNPRKLTPEQTAVVFVASVLQVCDRIGIKLKKKGWPDSLKGKTLQSLSEVVLE